MKYVYLLLIIVLFIPLVYSSQNTIEGVRIEGVNFTLEFICGEPDGVCPTELDPLNRPCNVPDPDCINFYNQAEYNYSKYINGTSFCEFNYLCGDGDERKDGICPSDLDPLNRMCYAIDNDCDQCEVFNTQIYANEPINSSKFVNMKSKVHGDNCIRPNNLNHIWFKNSSIEGCEFSISWNNLEHNFLDENINATGNVSSESQIGVFQIPQACSEKEVCVDTNLDYSMYFRNKSNNNLFNLSTTPTGCFDVGEIDYECSIHIHTHVNDTYGNNLTDVSVQFRDINGEKLGEFFTDSHGLGYIIIPDAYHNITQLIEDNNGNFTLVYQLLGYYSHINETVNLTKVDECRYYLEYNATLQPGLTLCQSDCTMQGSNICDARCHGINECYFEDK
ncbi:MAG: hypothetical protein ACMXX8_02110, partial [Candidatus Woesearchaeota archaeon]